MARFSDRYSCITAKTKIVANILSDIILLIAVIVPVNRFVDYLTCRVIDFTDCFSLNRP